MTATTSTSRYCVAAMDPSVAADVRATLVAPDYDHPAYVEIAGDPAPCRVCLGRFEPGQESRILFTYDPFRVVEPELPLPGPIFIHEDECTPYAPSDGFPESLTHGPLTFNAYADDRRLVAAPRTAVEDRDAVEHTIALLLADPEIRYIHVRSTRAGCFLCQVERAQGA